MSLYLENMRTNYSSWMQVSNTCGLCHKWSAPHGVIATVHVVTTLCGHNLILSPPPVVTTSRGHHLPWSPALLVTNSRDHHLMPSHLM